ncbi:MAG TPA: SRPBCC family protein [Flavisolibacter sp.]
MDTITNEKITIRTTVHAPIEKVWETWTSPNHITAWNFASDDWHAPFAENDLRTGGSFRCRMEARDGSMGFDFGGTYDLVDPMKRIDYTMEDGRKVNVTFTETENGVDVAETFDPEQTNPRDMQRDGWQSILDNYRKYTETV